MSKRFKRQGWKIKRVGTSWRRPIGKQSKMRQYLSSKAAMPNAGYGTPRAIRNKHPSGLYEVRIFNAAELEGINPKTHAVRIAAVVGRKSRIIIAAAAQKLGLRVLNPQRILELNVPKLGTSGSKTEALKTEAKKEVAAKTPTKEAK